MCPPELRFLSDHICHGNVGLPVPGAHAGAPLRLCQMLSRTNRVWTFSTVKNGAFNSSVFLLVIKLIINQAFDPPLQKRKNQSNVSKGGTG